MASDSSAESFPKRVTSSRSQDGSALRTSSPVPITVTTTTRDSSGQSDPILSDLQDPAHAKSLTNLINTLHDLAQTATTVVDDATEAGLSREVTEILVNTKTAVRKASNVQQRQREALQAQGPFKVSDSNKGSSLDSVESDVPITISSRSTSRGNIIVINRERKQRRHQRAISAEAVPQRQKKQYKTPSWDPKLYGMGSSSSYYNFKPNMNGNLKAHK